MLTAEERASLLSGQFGLTLTSLAISPVDSSRDPSVTGVGILAQGDGGKLELSYVGRIVAPPVMAFPRHPPGTLTDLSDMPTLRATDALGRVWTGSPVRLPPLCLPGTTSGTGTVAVDRIVATSETSTDGPTLRLLIPGTFILPLSRWDILDEAVRISLVQLENGLQVEVHSQDQLPVGYDGWLEEALWFTTGVVSTAVLTESRSSGGLEAVISPPTTPAWKSFFPPPLRPLPSNAGNLAEIFRRYLAYVSGGKDGRFHPTSADLKTVGGGGRPIIDHIALAVSVAVEALVRREYPTDGTPTAAVQLALGELKEHVEAWPGDAEARRRVTGSIQQMLRPNPRSALQRMSKDGPLLPRHYDDWNALRHAFAHGVGHQDGDLDLLVKRCFSCYQALQALILERIGYVGTVVDCTTTGWPTVTFPFRRDPPGQNLTRL
ncbi:MAG: hypothetical protein U0974_01230 [Gemmatimonadales bacterium]|nr:hypothetical protein [Gemmatimonadales bacterium]MDZ4388338.1 hypothetical protein [Gemmatimonadales bacterium]